MFLTNEWISASVTSSGLRVNMLKVLEQLNSEPRVVLENINDKLIRDGFQCGSNSLAKHSTGDAGSGGNMQRYFIKKHSDPSTSASLNLTLVGTGVPAPIKRKASLEQALSDADGAYQRPKKAKKGNRAQLASEQPPVKLKGVSHTEKLKVDKQKGSDSDSKGSNVEKSLKRKSRIGSKSVNDPASPVVNAGSDADSQPLSSLHKKEKTQERKQKKLLEKRNSVSSNPERDPEAKSPTKSAEQDINHSSLPLEASKPSMTANLDDTMELPRPDSAMTVALDADGQPVALSDQDDLTEPGGDVANLNDFSIEESSASDRNSELPVESEVVPPETNVTESDPPTPQIVTSFTLANLNDAEGVASAVQSPVSKQADSGDIESQNATVDKPTAESEKVAAAGEAVEKAPPVVEEQNASSSTSGCKEAPAAEAVVQSEETTELAESAVPKGTDSIPVGNDVVQETPSEPMETTAIAEALDETGNGATVEVSDMEIAPAAVVEIMESREEPTASTSKQETTRPAECELTAVTASLSLKRKFCVIYRDLEADSLDKEERETRMKLQTIAAVLLDMKRSRRLLIKETRQLRAKSSVHEKEMAVLRSSLPSLEQRVKQLTDQEAAHIDERNRRASAAKEAHEKVFQTEIRLRELQLEICKKKLRIVVDMEKNEENPEVLAIRKQEEEASDLSREVERANEVQREAETCRLAAEELLNKGKEELGAARKQLEEVQRAMDVVEKELQVSSAEIEQSVARLRETDAKWKAKNLDKLNLEEALVRIETCRRLIHYDRQRLKFSRMSNPESESDDSDADVEKKEEKAEADAPKAEVSTVRSPDENAAATSTDNSASGPLRIHQRAARLSLEGHSPNSAPSSGRPSVSSSPAHADRSASIPQKSPSLIDSLAVRNVLPGTNNLTPAPFAHSPDDLTQSTISTVIPFYAQLVRGGSPSVVKDKATLCREVVVYCDQYVRYCRNTQTNLVQDQKAHHHKCATMMKDFLIPFYQLLVTKNKDNPVPWSVKEMLDFVQNKANECNWYDIPEPRPSSKIIEFHLRRAVEFAVRWKDKSFTSGSSSAPVNTVTFSPATGNQLATYTIHPAPAPVAAEPFRSPSGGQPQQPPQQPPQVAKIAESSVPNAVSSASPMNALNSMITNQSRVTSSDEAAIIRSRQQAAEQQRQFSNAYHGATIVPGSVASSASIQAVLHQQRPILQVQPLPTSTSWQMARPPVTYVQRFHHMPYPPAVPPPQQAPPHSYRMSSFSVEQQQLLMNDHQGRPAGIRGPMPQQQPTLMRQHSIPPMSGQQPMPHHSNQLPPQAHHSQLGPAVPPMYLQTRQHAQPQPQSKQQLRAVEQVQQPQPQMVAAVYRCLKCGLEADQKCSGCQNTYYCSRECQVSHWDEHAKNCASQ